MRLLLPNLTENYGKFLHRTFFGLLSFYPNILWLQKVFLHCLNLPFPFPIVYAWSLHARFPLKVHAWSSRWVQRWLNKKSYSARQFFNGLVHADLFLTLFRWIVHCLDCSYWSITLYRPLLLAGSALQFCVIGPEAFLACCICLDCFFITPCYAFRLGERICVCFLTVYSFDTVPVFFLLPQLYWRIYLSFFFLTIRCNNLKTCRFYIKKCRSCRVFASNT